MQISATDTTAEEAFEAALERAIAERDFIDHHVAALGVKREILTKAIDSMLPLLRPDRRAFYLQKLNRSPEPTTERGGAIYSNVVALFKSTATKEWSAPAIQDALQARGIQAETKQVHNVLNYLEREGTLKRVARGRYLFLGAGIVTSDQLGENPWMRACEDE